MFVDADDWLEPNAVEVLLNVAISTSAEIVQATIIEMKMKK